MSNNPTGKLLGKGAHSRVWHGGKPETSGCVPFDYVHDEITPMPRMFDSVDGFDPPGRWPDAEDQELAARTGARSVHHFKVKTR